jgi:hypothetical protein
MVSPTQVQQSLQGKATSWLSTKWSGASTKGTEKQEV